MKPKFKKVLTIVLLSVSLSLAAPPKQADALFGLSFDLLNAAVQAIGHGIQGALLGIDAAANTIQASLQTVREVLNGIPIQYGPARKVLSVAVTGCEVIGGDLFAAQSLTDLRNIGPTDSPLPTEAQRLLTTPPPQLESHYSSPYPNTRYGLNDSVKNSLNDLSSLVETGDATRPNTSLVLGRTLGLLKYKHTCFKIIKRSLDTAMVVGSWNEQLKQAFSETLQEINVKSTPVNSQMISINDQLKKAKQDLFKSLAWTVAHQVNESNTQKTVDDLKPKLTVGSYGKVNDALAKRVYAVEAIKKGYADDKEKQLIMTTFLDAEIAPEKTGKKQALRSARALVQAQLERTCPQNYDFYSFNDWGVFFKAYLSISPECYEIRMFNLYREEFNKLLAQAEESSRMESAAGAGFLSTRACKDMSTREKQVALSTAQAARDLQEAKAKRTQLEQARLIDESSYINAINDEKRAADAVRALPAALDGGITESCGKITDAGGFVKVMLENYIDQWLSNTMNKDNPGGSAELAKVLGDKLFKGIVLNPSQSHNVLSETGSGFLNAILGFPGSSTRVQSPEELLTGGLSAPVPPARSSLGVLGVSTPVPMVDYFSPRGVNSRLLR